MFNDSDYRIIDFVHPNYFKIAKILRPYDPEPPSISDGEDTDAPMAYKGFIQRSRAAAAEESSDSDNDDSYLPDGPPSRRSSRTNKPPPELPGYLKSEREDPDYVQNHVVHAHILPNLALRAQNRLTIASSSEESDGDLPGLEPMKSPRVQQIPPKPIPSRTSTPGCDGCPHGSDSDCPSFRTSRRRSSMANYNDLYTKVNGVPVHLSDSDRSTHSSPSKSPAGHRQPPTYQSPVRDESLQAKSSRTGDSQITEPQVVVKPITTPTIEIPEAAKTSETYVEVFSPKSPDDLLRSPIDMRGSDMEDQETSTLANVEWTVNWKRNGITCPRNCGREIISFHQKIDRWDPRCDDLIIGHFRIAHGLDVQVVNHTCDQCNGEFLKHLVRVG